MPANAMYETLPQGAYENAVIQSTGWTKQLIREMQKNSANGELTKFRELSDREKFQKSNDLAAQDQNRHRTHKAAAKNLLKKMILNQGRVEFGKAGGVTSSTGFNFYDLRAPVQLSYPVHVPLRNELARLGKVNAGVGVMANWKSSRNPGYVYGGASEGNRVAVRTPSEENYAAFYKELGEEGSVTFTAQFAGEGYADNLADEQLRTMQVLWLQEEAMNWMGNSGNVGGSTNATGFKLGTAATPTTALVATHTTPGAAGNLNLGAGYSDLPYTTINTTSNYVSVAVVALTAMGNPTSNQYGYTQGLIGGLPTIANGLTTSWTRSNADGSVDIIPGGMSAISAAVSTPLLATAGNLTVKATITSVKGAFSYAWFVDTESSNTGSLGSAKLAGITTTPFAYITGTATGTQTGTAAGLNVDNSFNALDYDGLFSFSAATPGAYYKDLLGASLTSEKNGRIVEFETVFQSIYSQYQAGVDKIWMSTDAATSVDWAIRYGGTQPSATQFFYTRDGQNNLLGGFVVSAYLSRFATNNPNGAKAVPLVIHPMLPAGTVYFDISENPYPASRVEYSRAILLQRDYYAIEWPLTSRKWPIGVYTHQVLAHNFPWIAATLTGIGPFNSSQ